MKSWDELDSMTLFDIASNEGFLTNFIVGIMLILLSIGLIFIWLYYKLIFPIILKIRRRRH